MIFKENHSTINEDDYWLGLDLATREDHTNIVKLEDFIRRKNEKDAKKTRFGTANPQ